MLSAQDEHSVQLSSTSGAETRWTPDLMWGRSLPSGHDFSLR